MRDRRFLWGVATSAFQLEGSPHADWSEWDSILKDKPTVTNHYTLYKQDLNLLKDLGVNAYRFSIEWSRIQPTEKKWDHEVIKHYQELVDILLEHNIEPMVTLHHFTNPCWFAQKYPWNEDASIEVFLNYIEKVLSKIEGVRYWITFNEPYILVLGGYLQGCMPPGCRNVSMAMNALENILTSHGRAYDIIHSAVS